MIPDFSDVILNFASPEIQSPSFIGDLSRSRRGQAVFYGDETWLRMFPRAFLRSEGVTSFFVTDYTEVGGV